IPGTRSRFGRGSRSAPAGTSPTWTIFPSWMATAIPVRTLPSKNTPSGCTTSTADLLVGGHPSRPSVRGCSPPQLGARQAGVHRAGVDPSFQRDHLLGVLQGVLAG